MQYREYTLPVVLVLLLYVIHVYWGWQREPDLETVFRWMPRAMAWHLAWSVAGIGVLVLILKRTWPVR